MSQEVYPENMIRHFGAGELSRSIEIAANELKTNPDDLAAHYVKGMVHLSSGEHELAVEHLRKVSQNEACGADVWKGLAESLGALKKYQEAKAAWLRSISISFDVQSYAGYFRLPHHEKTIADSAIVKGALYKQLTITPEDATVYLLLSRLFIESEDFEKASNSYLAAVGCANGGIRIMPLYARFLYETSRISQALRVYQELIELEPEEPQHRVALAGCSFRMGDLEQAEIHLSAALELDPYHVTASLNLALVFGTRCEFEKAISLLDNVLNHEHIMPDIGKKLLMPIQVQKAYYQKWLGDEDYAIEGLREALLNPPDQYIGNLEVSPFQVMALIDSPELQLHLGRRFERNQIKVVSDKLSHSGKESGKIKVGWFGSDFHSHATMYLLNGVFREYDRDQFDFRVYSYGKPSKDKYRQDLVKSVECFYEMYGADDQEIIDAARADQLDIAIDLKGYTAGGRTSIFEHRMAPIQISYLGYPGTSGKDCFDYLVADEYLIPPEHRQYYSESVIYMPDCYQPNDNMRQIALVDDDRRDWGLPDSGIVFGSFNQIYKIGPEEFSIWSELLASIPRSVLWLYAAPESRTGVLRQLSKFGIEEERVIFAHPIGIEAHLNRLKHIDIFLDSFVVNGHTTTSDALFAGVPVVSMSGQQFAARVSGSLLKAAGFESLIARDKSEYRKLALRLAQDDDYRNQVRHEIAKKLPDSALYNSRGYTNALLEKLRDVVRISKAGEPPRDL